MLTESARSWLQELLRQRLHDGVRLHRRGESLALALEGAEGHITFADGHAAFAADDQGLPCAIARVDEEGWSTTAGRLGLPTPGLAAPPQPLVTPHADGWHIGYDVPGLCWWMLSRREEVAATGLDRHDRFPAAASHALRHGYLDRPIVDEWIHLVGQVAVRLWPQIALRGGRFEMRPSHDVDFPSRYAFRTRHGLVREIGLDLLRRHRPANLLTAARVLLTSRSRLSTVDPANTFDWLMDTSERRGLRSAFYFLCGRTAPELDASYDPEDPAIRGLLRSIHARGHEIGLHPSYGTYLSPALLTDEAARLRRVCEQEGVRQDLWGGRMHYLRWRTPDTLHGWVRAGMSYDSTLGYPDHAGFRCGTCHEFQAFDPIEDRPLPLRVVPLIAMEGTIMSDQYMGLGTGQAAFEALARLKDACRAVGGIFTLLWHNSELGEPELRDLYTSVVAH